MTTFDKNSKILVTGSGGVLGQALLKYLQTNSFQHILSPNRQTLDLLDATATNDYFSENQPDIVIHLASLVFGLAGNMKNQMLSAIQNTAINNNLFSAINNFPVKKIFFAGTVASYPFPYITLPLEEKDFFTQMPHYGEFGYAMAKRHAYTYLEILRHEKNIPYVYGIFTNLYGEHDRFDIENGHVIPSLIAKAHHAKQTNTTLKVWGDGSAERDFLYAGDAARAIHFLLNQEKHTGIINISTGQAVTIKDIAKIVAQSAKVDDLEFLIDKPVGIPNRVVSNQKLLELGFTHQTTIEEGLRATYHWYDNHPELRRMHS